MGERSDKLDYIVSKVVFVLNILILLTYIPYLNIAFFILVTTNPNNVHDEFLTKTLPVLLILSIYPLFTIALIKFNIYLANKNSTKSAWIIAFVNTVFILAIVRFF